MPEIRTSEVGSTLAPLTVLSLNNIWKHLRKPCIIYLGSLRVIPWIGLYVLRRLHIKFCPNPSNGSRVESTGRKDTTSFLYTCRLTAILEKTRVWPGMFVYATHKQANSRSLHFRTGGMVQSCAEYRELMSHVLLPVAMGQGDYVK